METLNYTGLYNTPGLYFTPGLNYIYPINIRMPPRRFTPSIMTNSEIDDNILDINRKLDQIENMRSKSWDQWGESIRHDDPQEVIDRHEKNAKYFKRRISMYRNRLQAIRDEQTMRRRRDLGLVMYRNEAFRNNVTLHYV